MSMRPIYLKTRWILDTLPLTTYSGEIPVVQSPQILPTNMVQDLTFFHNTPSPGGEWRQIDSLAVPRPTVSNGT